MAEFTSSWQSAAGAVEECQLSIFEPIRGLKSDF